MRWSIRSPAGRLATLSASDDEEVERNLKRLANLKAKRRLQRARVLYPNNDEQAHRPARSNGRGGYK